MLLDQPGETPFDLRFRIFTVPVRVHPFFWLSAVFLGFDLLQAYGIAALLIWIACLFVSILLHELGHVWMGWAFGSRGEILLQGFGGLAIGSSAVHGRWRRIAVYLAGPGIQLLFFGLLLGLLMAIDRRPLHFWDHFRLINTSVRAYEEAGMGRVTRLPDMAEQFSAALNALSEQPGWPQLVQLTVRFLISINLWWAIINLMPVWPLDGGQVSRELFVWANRPFGVRNSLALSVATALVLTINALSVAMHGPGIPYLPTGGVLFVFLFGALAFTSFITLQMELARIRGGWRDAEDDERMPWERDPDEWKRQ